MDIFFQDPNEIPLPPDEVRILNFTATPYPDGRRVRVFMELTPFQKRPNVTVYAENAENRRVAEVSIIETMTRKMEFTMHLRGPVPVGDYYAHALVFYVPTQQEQESGEQLTLEQDTKTIVDRNDTKFSIEPLISE